MPCSCQLGVSVSGTDASSERPLNLGKNTCLVVWSSTNLYRSKPHEHLANSSQHIDDRGLLRSCYYYCSCCCFSVDTHGSHPRFTCPLTVFCYLAISQKIGSPSTMYKQGRKLWHERSDADACSTSSQQASLPPAAAAPAVQWLPIVHPSRQVLALPALPAAHAGPAAAVADAQAERARDAVGVVGA